MPRTPRLARVELSPSGLSRFNDCETRWLWRPADDAPEFAKGRPLALGTVVHELTRARWRRQDWRGRVEELAAEMFEWEPGFGLPDVVETAVWLVERHEAVYPELPRALATEMQFDLTPAHDRDLHIRGYQDSLVLVEDGEHDGIWIVETKTYGKRDRLDWLMTDPQVGTYAWAAREQGFEVQGVLFDGILTTRWTTPEGEVYKTGARAGQPKAHHPPADSFDRLWLPWDARLDKLVAVTLAAYDQAAERIRAIEAGATPIQAIGRNCLYCPAYAGCWE